MSKAGLLLLVVAFGGGGLLGYLFAAGSGDVVFEKAGHTGAKGTAPEPERELPPMPEAPASGYASLTEALDDVPCEPEQDGTGMISGTVKSHTGEPLAGVVVRATLQRDPSSYRRHQTRSGVPEDEDLDELARKYIARIKEDRQNRREGRSDGAGRFVVHGISDGKYYLQAYKEGYQFSSADQSSYRVSAGGITNFIGKPLGTFVARLTLPDGSAPESGFLEEKLARGNSKWHNWHPDSPSLELSPGPHVLTAVAGEYKELKSPEVTVEVVEGVSPGAIDFPLAGRPGLRGNVEFPPGQGGYVMVHLLALKPGEEPDEKRLAREGQSKPVQSSNPVYSFPDLTAGTWAIGISFDRQKIECMETVTVGSEMTVKDLVLPEPDRADYVAVIVEGPDGGRLTDVRFLTGVRSEGGSRSGSSRFLHQGDGTYSIWHARMEPEQIKGSTTWTITAISPRYGTKVVEYQKTAASAVTINFQEPGTLTVTVLGASGPEAPKVGLKLVPKAGGSSGSSWFHPGQNNQLDEKGSRTFPGLAPGEYDLVLYLERDRSQYYPAARVPVSIKSGLNTENLSLPSFHTLTVMMGDVADGGSASLRQTGERSGRSFYANAKITGGKAVFERVPAGTFEIRAQGGRMSVTLPGQSVVQFTVEVKDCYQVEITDTTGRLAAAGLANGDLVVAIDGTELTDSRQMSALLRAAYVKERATLTVVRGRSRVNIEVDLRRESGEAGGTFKPAAR
jgi:PDZ domain